MKHISASVSARLVSDVRLFGELEAGDESGEREADESEEGHADGRRRRVGEHVVRALAHAVGDRDRSGQRRHHQVGGNLEKRRATTELWFLPGSGQITDMLMERKKKGRIVFRICTSKLRRPLC